MIHDGVCPRDAANFLNQMKYLVTLTGLELTLLKTFGTYLLVCMYVHVCIAREWRGELDKYLFLYVVNMY